MILSSKNPSSRLDPSSGVRRLTFCLEESPRNLDPRKLTDMTSAQIQFMLLEGLLRLNADGILLPGQAERYQFSDDFKKCTFYLRDSYWSDGSLVTAHDFEYSIKSTLDSAFPSPDCYAMYPIKNAQAAKTNQVSSADIGIFSINKKTLVIETHHPCPYLPQLVASYSFLPVNRSEAQDNPDWAYSSATMMANGPFYLATWEPDQGLLLKKNTNYWNSDNINIEEVLIWIIGDTSFATRKMYAEGAIDLLGDPVCPVPYNIIQEIKRQKIEDKVLDRYIGSACFFLALNNKRNPTNNLDVRKGLSLAINREKLIKSSLQSEILASSLLLPHLSRSSDDDFFYYNPAEARRFFESGLQSLQDQGEEIQDISITSFKEDDAIIENIQHDWSSALGVDVRIKKVDFKWRRQLQAQGAYHAMMIGAVLTYNDPMSLLERFEPSQNYALWQDFEYINTIRQAKQSTNQADYTAAITAAERVIKEKVPLIPVFYETIPILTPYYIDGVRLNPLGYIDFHKIEINEALRKACEDKMRKRDIEYSRRLWLESWRYLLGRSSKKIINSKQRDYRDMYWRSGSNFTLDSSD